MTTEYMTLDEYHALASTTKQPATRTPKTDYNARLLEQIRMAGLPAPVLELVFARPRRWRFDMAWPALEGGVALEYEGMAYHGGKSRHTTISGFEGDCEKYSEAAIRGWRVIRVTAAMVEDGRALALVQRALACEVQP